MSHQSARPARILVLVYIAVLALGRTGAMPAGSVSSLPLSLTPAAVSTCPCVTCAPPPACPRGSYSCPPAARVYPAPADRGAPGDCALGHVHAIAIGHACARLVAISDCDGGCGQPTRRARRVRADPRGRAAAHAARARRGARDLAGRRHARRTRRMGRALPETTGLAARASYRET